MSEKIKPFGAPARLNPFEPGSERSVVLPFPDGKLSTPRAIGSADSLHAVESRQRALPLIKLLCDTLNDERILYCHWKSNWKLNRWVNGEGDLDLLIDISDMPRFTAIVGSLGFKQAVTEQTEPAPGVFHFYGWDDSANKFVHLHAYCRLLIGNDLTTNFRLPIERLLLESSSSDHLMPVPSVELELVIFVVRKILGYSASESFIRKLAGKRDDSKKTAAELSWLKSRTKKGRVLRVLSSVLPAITPDLFNDCLAALSGNSSWRRTIARHQLQKVMKAHAMRGQLSDGALSSARFFAKLVRERVMRAPRCKHFVNGGLLIALVGGDGAGKTTAIKEVRNWLGEDFKVKTFHFGKPKRSPVTIATIVALRTQKFLKKLLKVQSSELLANSSQSFRGYIQLFRWVCAARDRHRVYLNARRFAARGGIAVCDRFVIPSIHLMDGPNVEQSLSGQKLNWLSRLLLKAENKRYEQIMEPDLLMVLRLDPEVAVRRKTDEQEAHVRSRSTEVWQNDWSKTRAHVIDANRSVESVMAEIRSIVWQQL